MQKVDVSCIKTDRSQVSCRDNFISPTIIFSHWKGREAEGRGAKWAEPDFLATCRGEPPQMRSQQRLWVDERSLPRTLLEKKTPEESWETFPEKVKNSKFEPS